MRKTKGMLLLCIIVTVFFLVGLIFWGLNLQKQKAINNKKESLQILANEKALLTNTFLEDQKEKLLIISSMNVLKQAAQYPNDSAKIETAKERINELKSILPGISILNNEGIAIIGEFDLPGTDYSQHPYFMAKGQDISFSKYYCPLRKKDYYAIIGPLYNKSKLIGRIAFDIELDKISTLMKEPIESETSEVYLIDETGLLLSGSKYIGEGNKNGILIQEVASEGAKACLEDLKKYQKDGAVEEHEEEVMKYANYIGEEVFGAHAYTADILGCVIAEVSADEVTESPLTGYLIAHIKNIFEKEVKNEN
ncbi:MAG: cache domain-containing protein [Candidatus Woesearchaeota archaeon]